MTKKSVTLFEVGPRDGLQNEPRTVSLKNKIWFVSGLLSAGVKELELGSFVRPERVPQMADTELIYKKIKKGVLQLDGSRAWSLVPNLKGLERAIASGVRHIAVFTAASETFNRKNIGMSVRASLNEIKEIIQQARAVKMQVRGYVSTAFACPFEGKIQPRRTLKIMERLLEAGVFQVSIGDTIGVATPREVDAVIGPALRLTGTGEQVSKIAVHFHDTRGTALANALRSLELGVRNFDSSAGGLGGCPFAPGARGNLATEDLVYMLHGMGFKTGIDLNKLSKVSLEFARRMNRPLTSRYLMSKC